MDKMRYSRESQLAEQFQNNLISNALTFLQF